MANWKLGKVRNLGNLGKIIPSFLISKFPILPYSQNRKLGFEIIGKKFPRFLRFPRCPRFGPDRFYQHLTELGQLSLGKPIDSYWFKIFCLSLFYICVHCFFLKMMKLYKDNCSAWISRTSAEFFFLIGWRHKLLKNTIDLLLFYGENFSGFSESELKWLDQTFSFSGLIIE